MDETAAAVDRLVAEQGVRWPQLWDGKGYEGAVPKLYAMDGTPLLYLIDRAGRLAGRFRSVTQVEQHLPEVLAAPASVPRTGRDEWQRPYALMDRLRIGPGTVVADVASGKGYLTWHLAARVGKQGRVYAVDIDPEAHATLRESARTRELSQVEAVLGTAEDPRLAPASLDVAVIVDSYHEFTAHEAMLRAIHAALKPGGRLGVVETSDTLGRARGDYGERHRLPTEILVEEAARHGLRLASFDAEFARGTRDTEYLVVLEKPK